MHAKPLNKTKAPCEFIQHFPLIKKWFDTPAQCEQILLCFESQICTKHMQHKMKERIIVFWFRLRWTDVSTAEYVITAVVGASVVLIKVVIL